TVAGRSCISDFSCGAWVTRNTCTHALSTSTFSDARSVDANHRLKKTDLLSEPILQIAEVRRLSTLEICDTQLQRILAAGPQHKAGLEIFKNRIPFTMFEQFLCENQRRSGDRDVFCSHRSRRVQQVLFCGVEVAFA